MKLFETYTKRQRTLSRQLDDLDCADDVALISFGPKDPEGEELSPEGQHGHRYSHCVRGLKHWMNGRASLT